jgi:hypothetical protein
MESPFALPNETRKKEKKKKEEIREFLNFNQTREFKM